MCIINWPFKIIMIVIMIEYNIFVRCTYLAFVKYP